MVRSVAQHARDDAPLFGYPQALLVTKGLNIDRLSHARSLGPADTKGKSPRPYFRLQRPPRPLFTLGTLRTQRSEEHTSELQSLMRISYAVFCLKKKKTSHKNFRTQTSECNTQITHKKQT